MTLTSLDETSWIERILRKLRVVDQQVVQDQRMSDRRGARRLPP
jgi:hypothetical protein